MLIPEQFCLFQIFISKEFQKVKKNYFRACVSVYEIMLNPSARGQIKTGLLKLFHIKND
jgi:hypothetical protein